MLYLKKPTNELVDEALWLWFVQERRKGTHIINLHSKLENSDEFSACDGWLTQWKKCHVVHYLSICGENLSADPTAANE
ncbi:hypothetical protein PR048_017333 [Dryococelus australis]|uniref:HTH CENPB-type domain-containing protein n=1 Tax=Dryococelus australis TaxID=614101 RepID=A0ABQ9H980_9NEOP|nr:hypothetical protein PR048_017333 [Dryococelus australis]